MDEQNTWCASSKSIEEPEDQDFSALAGRWNEKLHVVISLPATLTQGPITQHFPSITRPCAEPTLQ